MGANDANLIWELLADQSRRAIVATLAHGPLPVGELAEQLPISRPAVSQHLRALKDAGVVTVAAQGTRRVYQLDPVALIAFRDQLDTFWRRALSGFHEIAEEEEQ